MKRIKLTFKNSRLKSVTLIVPGELADRYLSGYYKEYRNIQIDKIKECNEKICRDD